MYTTFEMEQSDIFTTYARIGRFVAAGEVDWTRTMVLKIIIAVEQ